MNSLWWLQIVWQMELKFSIIQTELGLSELNQGLHGKKTFFLMWNKDYIELITNSLLAYCSYRMLCTGLDWIIIIWKATGISIITFLNNGQMQSPHFAKCYLKGSTPSRNTALLATTTQSEPKYCLLTFSGIDAGDCVQARHLKKMFSLFIFLFSHLFLRINLMYWVLRALQKVP